MPPELCAHIGHATLAKGMMFMSDIAATIDRKNGPTKRGYRRREALIVKSGENLSPQAFVLARRPTMETFEVS
jgi:hypothetical protein